jgi:hypothetical protein
MGGVLFAVAMPFAVIGAVMAFLITYQEMQHHFDRRRTIVESIKTAVAALALLVGLALAAAVFAPLLTR